MIIQIKHTQRYYWCYIILLALYACTQPDSHLVQALKAAGENKKELLKVLSHYKDNDSLKYEAACFLITDSIFYQSVKKALLKNDGCLTPTDYARYGYILYYLGNKIKAKQYLTKAVSALPNLSTPWYLLGEIKKMQHKEAEAELCMKKFRLLTIGAFQFSSPTANISKIRDAEDDDLIQDYILKFQDWYLSAI